MKQDPETQKPLAGIPVEIQPVGKERWIADKADIVLVGILGVILAVSYGYQIIHSVDKPLKVLVLLLLGIFGLTMLAMIFRSKIHSYKKEYRK